MAPSKIRLLSNRFDLRCLGRPLGDKCLASGCDHSQADWLTRIAELAAPVGAAAGGHLVRAKRRLG